MMDRQVGGPNGRDTRFPDWHIILGELKGSGECVVQFRMENVTDGDLLQHVRRTPSIICSYGDRESGRPSALN